MANKRRKPKAKPGVKPDPMKSLSVENLVKLYSHVVYHAGSLASVIDVLLNHHEALFDEEGIDNVQAKNTVGGGPKTREAVLESQKRLDLLRKELVNFAHHANVTVDELIQGLVDGRFMKKPSEPDDPEGSETTDMKASQS